jgi:hypothetical protein
VDLMEAVARQSEVRRAHNTRCGWAARAGWSVRTPRFNHYPQTYVVSLYD